MSQRVTPPQRDEILDEVWRRSLEIAHAREEAALESILEEEGIPQQERDIYYERLRTFRDAFSRGDIDTWSEIVDHPLLRMASVRGRDTDERATHRSILRRVLDEHGVSEENRSVYFDRLREREDSMERILKEADAREESDVPYPPSGDEAPPDTRGLYRTERNKERADWLSEVIVKAGGAVWRGVKEVWREAKATRKSTKSVGSKGRFQRVAVAGDERTRTALHVGYRRCATSSS